MLHGKPGWKKRRAEEPESIAGPGSSASRTRTASKSRLLYNDWRDLISVASFGVITKTTVRQDVFRKGIKDIKESLGEGDHEMTIRKAFEHFAGDVKSKKVSVAGKDAWFVFYGRRAKYLEAARVHTTAERTLDQDIKGTWT